MTPVKVLTTVAAWPEALVAMRELLNRHLHEDFEFIAIVDTPTKPGPYNLWDASLREKSVLVANRVCDSVLVVPERIHKNRKIQFPATSEPKGKNANTRAADTLQFAWNQVIKDSSVPVLILDNDMFPVRDFSIFETLGSSVLAGIYSTSPSKDLSILIPWIWSGLLFINPSKMARKEIWSFDCGKIENVPVDVSGQTFHWLKYAESVGVKPNWLSHHSSLKWKLSDTSVPIPDRIIEFMEDDDRNQNDKFYCEFYNDTFIHFRAGSNWKKEPAEIVKRRNQDFLSAMIGES
jgi:hypothetical protein